MLRTKNHKGFTLVELMITIGIAGMLLAVGVPSMRSMIEKNRVAAESRSLITAFNFARSEAITRKAEVNVEPTDGADWSNGITVWTDDNGNGVMDNNNQEVLQVYPELEASTITPSAAVARVQFDDDGFLDEPPAAPTFELQLHDCSRVDGRNITVNLSGRVNLAVASCP